MRDSIRKYFFVEEGKINVLELRVEREQLFWNLIWYFIDSNLAFDFVLPYLDDVKSEKAEQFKMVEDSVRVKILQQRSELPLNIGQKRAMSESKS